MCLQDQTVVSGDNPLLFTTIYLFADTEVVVQYPRKGLLQQDLFCPRYNKIKVKADRTSGFTSLSEKTRHWESKVFCIRAQCDWLKANTSISTTATKGNILIHALKVDNISFEMYSISRRKLTHPFINSLKNTFNFAQSISFSHHMLYLNQRFRWLCYFGNSYIYESDR